MGAITINPQIMKLMVGFLLTTLCGGFLGFIFQRRHARYQCLQNRAEKEMETCQAVFEEVSRLLDKRLYRTRQLLHFLNSQDAKEQKLAEYIEVVTQWNENINRILALIEFSFGRPVRDSLDYDVGTAFVNTGKLLEDSIRNKTQIDSADITQRLDTIAAQVYQFNMKMLVLIKDKRDELHKI
jgi:hypothetical protein